MITVNEPFEFGKDALLLYLKNGLTFLFRGYKIVLTKKQYSLSKDGKNLENDIRDAVYNEARRLLLAAIKNNRSDRSLRFDFYNEPRDTSNEDDIKRFDITLNYDSAIFNKDIIIECKRLNKNGKNQAYIDNGIQRFITDRYGHSLAIGGMIGFIEQGKEPDILKDLQKRINTYSTTSRKLNPVSNNSSFSVTEYKNHLSQSNHKRNKGLEDIELYHLLMDFTSIISD